MRWHVLTGRITVLYQYNPAKQPGGRMLPASLLYPGGFRPPEALSFLASGSRMLWPCVPLTCNNPAMAVLTLGQCHLADPTGTPPAGTPKEAGGSIPGSTARWFSESTWMVLSRSQCSGESWMNTWAFLGPTSGQKFKMSSW